MKNLIPDVSLRVNMMHCLLSSWSIVHSRLTLLLYGTFESRLKTILHKGTQEIIFTYLYKQGHEVIRVFLLYPLIYSWPCMWRHLWEDGHCEFGTSSSLSLAPLMYPRYVHWWKVWLPPIHALCCSLFHKLHCTSVSAQAPFVFVLPETLQEIGEYVLIAWHFPISCGEV
jgi:hypothetical protein